jgi:NAD(P)-dependent dehydrogenase (short-subunit alcohol dehydrogenase family)
VADVDRLFATALDRFGRLDIVVANAGVELVGQRVVDFTEADFDRLFSINAKGAFFTLQRAARHVVDNGRIIYVGSSTTAFPLPGRGLYGGSKIAVQFLVEVLAKEIGARGVTVNSILPTATEGAGVFADGVREEVMQFVRSFRPSQRMGRWTTSRTLPSTSQATSRASSAASISSSAVVHPRDANVEARVKVPCESVDDRRRMRADWRRPSCRT